MKRLLKKWWFWLLLIIAVGAVGFFIRGDQETVEYVTETTVREALEQTVDVSGEVESISEVELAFDISGELAEIAVAVGDTVEAGAVLARLNTTELEADVQSAYQAVQFAKAKLAEEKAGTSDETVAVSSASVQVAQAIVDAASTDLSNAKAYLNATQDKYATDIAAKKASRKTAQDNLAQVKIANNQLVNDAYGDLLSAAWAGVIGAQKSLSEADNVLGKKNGYANDDFKINLSARDPAALASARSAFDAALTSTNAAEDAILSLTYNSSGASIKAVAILVENALFDGAKLLLHTKKALEGTINNSAFTVTEWISMKATVDAARDAIQVDQASLENAFQTLENAFDSISANLTDAQNAFSEAEIALYATEALADQQVKSAEHSVLSTGATLALRQKDFEKSKAGLSETQAAPRRVDLASFEAEVARSIASYNASKARLDKAVITSPIAGNVTDIKMEVGEQVLAASGFVVVQTTEQQFKVLADISESDITKVHLNDTVSLTFDAYSDDIVVKGFVGELDPAEKLIEGVVYYQATIFFTEDVKAGISLRPGMSSDLIVLTDRREDAISIPQRAISEVSGKKMVRVLVGESPEDREITTGLRGDLGRIEVTSGLQVGDEVIIREIRE